MQLLSSLLCRILQAEHRLKPFHGIRVCFVGFPEEEEKHMTEVLVMNGGTVTALDDVACTHVVSFVFSFLLDIFFVCCFC